MNTYSCTYESSKGGEMTGDHPDNKVTSLRRPPDVRRLLTPVPAASQEEFARLLLDWLEADWQLTAPRNRDLSPEDMAILKQNWQRLYNRLTTSAAADSIQGDLLNDLLTNQVRRFGRRALADFLARVARRNPANVDVGDDPGSAEKDSCPLTSCGGG